MSTGMPTRTDRIHRYVTAWCPRCHAEDPDRPLEDVARLSGYLTEDGGRMWLVRLCPQHGAVRTLYDEHPRILRYLEEWTAPTKEVTPDSPGNYTPPPAGYRRGLGELQTQHTCVLLADIADRCNLTCPTCFTGSSPAAGGVVPVEDVLASVDRRLQRENGRLDVVMLSGGEPTLHPDFAELVGRLVEREIVRILVNSNGIRIARSDALLEVLVRHRDRVEIYLQYDGVEAATHRHHRGADLRADKHRAVQRLSDAGVFTTLTMTAALGVNEREIGPVIRLALDTPYVGGVSVQPQFRSGRGGEAIDPTDRLTHGGVLARLDEQTGGLVTWRDLTALPCSHPHCCSVGYLLRTDAGEWRSLVGVIGHNRLKEHLDLVSNRIADHAVPRDLRRAVKAALMGLLSEQSSLTHPTIGELFSTLCDACDLGLGTLTRLASGAVTGRPPKRLREMLARRVVRLTVKPFMDISTMLEERLLQCCVHVGTRDGDGRHQCAPFCAVQAWGPLSRTRLSADAAARGRSLPLVGMAGSS